VSEDDLLRTVLAMAKALGLSTAHFRPAKTKDGNWITAVAGDGKGFPDLVIAGLGGQMFRELKSAKGVLSPEQVVWIGELTRGGADAGVWRPADLRSGRIEQELRALRDPANAGRPDRKPTVSTPRKPAWMR
jgi:hypothetical protein